MMPPSMYFNYCGKVSPEFSMSRNVQLRQDPMPVSDLALNESADRRLVGFAPILMFENEKAILCAQDRKHATCSTYSFNFSGKLVDVLKPHDEIYLSDFGSLGVSLIRKKKLVFALGAIRGLPLGDIQIKTSDADAEIGKQEENVEFVFNGIRSVLIQNGKMLDTNGYSISLRSTGSWTVPPTPLSANVLSKNDLPESLRLNMLDYESDPQPTAWEDDIGCHKPQRFNILRAVRRLLRRSSDWF